MPKVQHERQIAARVAGCADLQDVRLFGVAANLETPVIDGGLSYSFSSNVTYQTLGEPIASLVVNGAYEVTVRSTDSDAEDQNPTDIADISFTLAALFTIPERDGGDDPFADDEFEGFAATTGQFALHPYAREFISDLTSRMGLPPLHIGTLRLELDSRED
jgi:hypothetical protein